MGLAGEPAPPLRRHQVTDTGPPPGIEGQVRRAGSGVPVLPDGDPRACSAHALGASQLRPEACAQAASLTYGHYNPVHRATVLLCQLAGITASTGWMAGIRARAAALIGDSGFMDRVRELLRAAPAVPRR